MGNTIDTSQIEMNGEVGISRQTRSVVREGQNRKEVIRVEIYIQKSIYKSRPSQGQLLASYTLRTGQED